MNVRSVTAIYLCAALACVGAPALGLATVDAVAVWPYVLFAGLPLSIMAVLLAVIHSQHGLVDRSDRLTALVWTIGVLIVLTPFDLWPPFRNTDLLRWAEATAAASIAVLFMRSTVQAWKQSWAQRIPLALGFFAVSVFFGSRAWRSIAPTSGVGLNAAADDLAEFFLDAVTTCFLLLPALAAAWFVRKRLQLRPTRR